MNGCIELSRKDGQGKAYYFYVSLQRQIDFKDKLNKGELNASLENDVVYFNYGKRKIIGFKNPEAYKDFKDLKPDAIKIDFRFPRDDFLSNCTLKELEVMCKQFAKF